MTQSGRLAPAMKSIADDEDAADAAIVREVLADPQGKGRLVTGEELRGRLERCLT